MPHIQDCLSWEATKCGAAFSKLRTHVDVWEWSTTYTHAVIVKQLQACSVHLCIVYSQHTSLSGQLSCKGIQSCFRNIQVHFYPVLKGRSWSQLVHGRTYKVTTQCLLVGRYNSVLRLVLSTNKLQLNSSACQSQFFPLHLTTQSLHHLMYYPTAPPCSVTVQLYCVKVKTNLCKSYTRHFFEL